MSALSSLPSLRVQEENQIQVTKPLSELRARWRSHAGHPVVVSSLDAFSCFRQWWGDIGPRLAPKTARTYRYQVFTAFALNTWEPVEIGARPLVDYLDSISRPHAESARSGLRDFFEFLVRQGYRADNPLAEIRRRARSRRRVRRGLEMDELTRLLIAAVWAGEGKSLWNGQRLAWAILAQAMTGLRPGELLSLTTDRIHLDTPNPWIQVYASKTDDERAVPLNLAACSAFTELCRGRVGRILPFGPTQYWSKMRRAAQAAALPPEKARPYALRHTFATQLLESGADIRVVSELLGHVDLRHTHVYTQPSDPRLRAAVARIGRAVHFDREVS